MILINKYFLIILINMIKINVSSSSRKISTLYDVVVTSKPFTNSIIANCSDILYNRKSLSQSTSIFKYKLIYYTPQVMSTEVLANSSNKLIDYKSEQLFSVDVNNGSIHMRTPNNEPLLEYLCLKKNYCICTSCIFTLNIIYSTENKINADTIKVFIDDSNDYAPDFINKDIELIVNISESSKIGDVFKLHNSIAYDSDALFNKIEYFLSTENIDNSSNLIKSSNLFEISKLNDKSADLNLILKAHLDYESCKSFELYLIARDNGFPNSYFCSKRLIVNVIDENDHNPICEKSLFIANINENSNERNFLRIAATDVDTGVNGRLEYSIEESDSKINSMFEIDKHSGWLSLKIPLDYEKKSTYDLKIKVQDSGLKNVFTTFCSARVNLIDLNDNPAKIKIIKYLNESVLPQFYSLNTMSDSLNEFSLETPEIRNQIEVFENNKPGTILAMIRVFDFDTLSNYKFAIQSAINSQDDTSMFQIRSTDKSSREFELITTSSFDAETVQYYKLKIILYDLQILNELDSNDTLMIKKPFKFYSEINSNNFQINLIEKIKVLDLNDNGPKFVKNFYEFELKENSFNLPLNQRHEIKAFDFDASDLNSNISYKIIEKNNLTYSSVLDHIYINGSLGNSYPLLIVSKPFDYEVDGRRIEFFLAVYDINNLTDTALISVRLIDQNDNYPLFMNENTTFFFKENMPANSFIGQAIAIDKDSQGPNSDISFRIVSNAYTSLFKIYKSGVISNKVSLDREQKGFYSIEIEAYDFGEPSLSRTSNYYIQIEDDNDNKPILIYPNESTNHLFVKTPTVWNNSKQFLTNIEAVDLDYDYNSQLKYSIDEESDKLLEIDSSNGSVYLDLIKLNKTNDLKRIIHTKFFIKDSGSPVQQTELNFTFLINYERSELPPDYFNSNKLFTLFEDSSLKEKLLKIISNNYILLAFVIATLILIMISSLILIVLWKRSIRHRSNKRKDKNSRDSKCNFEKFLLKTKNRFEKCFEQADEKIKNETNLTVKDVSSKEMKIELNEIKISNAQAENSSVLNSSLMNNCSLYDQNDQSYGFVNNTYSLVSHKANSVLNGFNLTDDNVKQLVNSLNVCDYQTHPYLYKCRIYENPTGSIQIVNASTTSQTNTTSFISSLNTSESSENTKCKELMSLTPAIFSENQICLSDNPHNSSKILQNLLVKFERFYNDAKI